MERPFPAYQGEEPYIFVSYAHADSALVFPELQRLRDLGFRVWYDEGISPGSSWRDELAESIVDCSLFVVFVTPNSVASENCIKEVNFAMERQKAALAVHLKPTELPPGLQLSLADRQAVMKYEHSELSYQTKLVSGIESYLHASPVMQSVEEKTGNRLVPALVGGLAVIAVAAIFAVVQKNPVESDVPPPEAIPEVTTPTGQEDTFVVPEKGIVVLPFANLSNDPEQEFFSDGLTEDILTGLVRASDIKVVARTTSFQFKGQNRDARELGQLLDVSHLLEGSVRKAGNNVRVTAQLVSTIDGSPVWSDRYDRELTDIFAVQDEITGAILNELNLQLAATSGPVSVPTSIPDAYNAFLRARFHSRQLDLDRAEDLLGLAVSLDPEYADAWAELGHLKALRVWWMQRPISEMKASIEEHYQRALMIDPDNEAVLGFQRFYSLYGDKDLQGLLDWTHEQVSQNPYDEQRLSAYRSALWAAGRLEEALRVSERWLEIDPLAASLHRGQGALLTLAGRYQEAEKALDTAESFGVGVAGERASLAIMRNDFEEVKRQLAKNDSEWNLSFHFHTSMSAYVSKYLNEQEAFQSALKKMKASAVHGATDADIAVLEDRFDDACAIIDRLLTEGEYLFVRGIHGDHLMTVVGKGLLERPCYEQVRRKHGLDSESLSRLKIKPVPF